MVYINIVFINKSNTLSRVYCEETHKQLVIFKILERNSLLTKLNKGTLTLFSFIFLHMLSCFDQLLVYNWGEHVTCLKHKHNKKVIFYFNNFLIVTKNNY